MTKEEIEFITKIKEYVFDPKRRMLCDNRCWCSLEDGYCPQYDCGSLDRLKQYNDRQWLNTIKKVQSKYPNSDIEDLVDEVLFEIGYKRPICYRK